VSALINPAWWLLCGALAICVIARDPHRELRRYLQWATGTIVLVVVAVAALANVGARAILGHAVPGDFVQEVVATRSLAAHATPYPADVNGAVRGWLVENPPRVPEWLPGWAVSWLHARQGQGRNRLVAQAHPPTLLLTMAPPVLLLGAPATYWALAAVTLASAALAAVWLVSALAPSSSGKALILAALAVTSWQPVLATVRDGQVSVMIGALLVLGWRELRRARDVRAGLLLGTAAALKLYPLVLLVLLAVRRRRAFAAAAVIVAVAGAGVALIAGPAVWIQYAASAREIARSFADAPYNLSMLARLGAFLPRTWLFLAYPVVACVFVGATLMAGRQLATSSPARAFDVEYAAFVTLSLALSPVAWHHYVFTLALPLAAVLAAAWANGRRWTLASVLALMLVLSLPDDAWRQVWSGVPPRIALLISPGVGVLLLWAALVAVRVRLKGGGAGGWMGVSWPPVRSDILTEPTST
jgi:alpha-1,2-mannosyltransferase